VTGRGAAAPLPAMPRPPSVSDAWRRCCGGSGWASWDKVHSTRTRSLAQVARARRPRRCFAASSSRPAVSDDAVHTTRKLYRYHGATGAIRQGYAECAVRSVPAAEVEEAVVAQVNSDQLARLPKPKLPAVINLPPDTLSHSI
jgi:hypothetical protein